MNSAIDCQPPGIIFALAHDKVKNKKAKTEEKTTKTVEFVIEKSKQKIVILNNLLIENCSRGEKKNIKAK
jgi:hypothetical protein|tara:strand:+ start:9151 stop:9360 length:210 start_codon:yes stop_codon:yes gene_type:complete